MKQHRLSDEQRIHLCAMLIRQIGTGNSRPMDRELLRLLTGTDTYIVVWRAGSVSDAAPACDPKAG